MKEPRQLGLAFGKPVYKWGGRREGAGRKPGKRKYVLHEARPFHEAALPVHVTWRFVDGLPPLRRKDVAERIMDAIAASKKDTFRVCHFSIQGNHLHCIVEATSKRALSRGMQGLAVRIARGVNGVLEREGQVFAERYHARELGSPREVKNCLEYVLLNSAKHARLRRGEFVMDPLTSGAWFTDWKWQPFVTPTRACPVAAPRTYLLRAGWKRHGLVDPEKVPGPARPD